jgi:Cupin-like domain
MGQAHGGVGLNGPIRIPVRRLQRLSQSDVRELMCAKEPVLVAAGGIDDWPALHWTPERLSATHGDHPVRVVVDAPDGSPWVESARGHLREMKFREYVEFLRSPDRKRPCYMALEPLSHLPGLDADVDIKRLCPHPSPEIKLSVGSPGVQIGVHFDYEDNIFVQIHGRKRFCLVSPGQSRLVYASERNITQSDLNDASDPDLERFPLFSQATIIDDVIGPGEMLCLPRTWWHHFRSLDETISLTCFFNRASFLHELVPIINQYGSRYWLRIAEQFVSYGILKKEIELKLYSHPPNGFVLYQSLIRRLLGLRAKNVGSFFE